ncbi:MAG TPA: N-acetyltransferase [Gemmataceae bacterium]|nr:N-acetyltransferase [Gemmataceae bacterium]
MQTPVLSESAVRPTTYFKRFRMEIDLDPLPPLPELPAGYGWVPWSYLLLDVHADVLYRSFQGEIDAAVFASLGQPAGCYCLMSEICRKSGFLPEATWLLAGPSGYCGTVQGVRERSGLGAIQNLGITPEHRGRGLGTALLLQALHGFRRVGLGRAFLEVTAQNEGAVRLYHRLGFRRRKTIYKAAPAAGVCPTGLLPT